MYEYKIIFKTLNTDVEFDEWINSYMPDGWRIRSTDIKTYPDAYTISIVLERRIKKDGTYINKHK